MSTKISVLLLYLLLLGLFANPVLPATEISDPVTTYSGEDGYNTYGYIKFSAPKRKIAAILWNFADYENWLLDGLTRDDPEAKKLTCTLNHMNYLSDENMVRVYFSLNIWFLKNKEYSVLFDIIPLGGGTGIKVDLHEDGRTAKILASLFYTISIRFEGNEAVLEYTGHCKLKGLAARFFTMNLYKKNVEWYIRTFANNFLKRLEA